VINLVTKKQAEDPLWLQIKLGSDPLFLNLSKFSKKTSIGKSLKGVIWSHLGDTRKAKFNPIIGWPKIQRRLRRRLMPVQHAVLDFECLHIWFSLIIFFSFFDFFHDHNRSKPFVYSYSSFIDFYYRLNNFISYHLYNVY
jgi:hypothetical protein